MITASGEKVRPLLDLKDLYTGDDWHKDARMFAGPLAWTVDGRHVLFAKTPAELWRIPAEGDKPQKLLGMEGASVPAICPLSLHPDGQRIAFGKLEFTPKGLWSMENLLPTFMAAR